MNKDRNEYFRNMYAAMPESKRASLQEKRTARYLEIKAAMHGPTNSEVRACKRALKQQRNESASVYGPTTREIMQCRCMLMRAKTAGKPRKKRHPFHDMPDEFLGPKRSEMLKAKKKERLRIWESRPEVRARRNAKNKAYNTSTAGRAARRLRARRYAANMTPEQYRKRQESWKRTNSSARHKLHQRLRVRLSKFYRGRNIGGCRALTGLSRDGLLEYLQSKLKPGMTMENYGSAWHIDHTIPCRAFDLSRIDEAQRCFHFSNLNPMWAKQNIRKGGKITKRQPELPFAFHE